METLWFKPYQHKNTIWLYCSSRIRYPYIHLISINPYLGIIGSISVEQYAFIINVEPFQVSLHRPSEMAFGMSNK